MAAPAAPTGVHVNARLASEGGGEPDPPGDLFPMTFDDSVFGSMTEHTTAAGNIGSSSLSHQSYVEGAGDPTIICEGGNTLSYVRVSSREGIRLTSGTVNLNWCYLHVYTVGDDHADAIQVYSPGDSGTWNISHCAIRNAASNAGIFCADNHESHWNLSYVLFEGGNYGFVCYADGNPCTLNFDHVYFVRDSFSFGEFALLSTVTVVNWTNVYLCDIVAGAVTNLSALASP